nr:CoA ester lyase [uncultured Shinella sp.]
MTKAIDHTCLHLFVPGDRPDRIQKAVSSGADAVVIDLEDAVAQANKADARSSLATSLTQAAVPLIVRINAVGTPWHAEDLAIVSGLPVDAVMLPKAESARDAQVVGERTGLPVVALIESAAGIENVVSIAKAVRRLAFGSIDYAADLSMGHTRQSLLMPRSQLVYASRLAGIAGPIDGVTTAIADEDTVKSDCAHAVELGFTGKLLIHPVQIKPAKHAFAPSEQELEWASRIHAMAECSGGAVRVDGQMIDAPVVARARQILDRAQRTIT